MSFFSALFGRGKAAPTAKLSDPVEYKGYVIRAAPYKNNGHYQTAGIDRRARSTACARSTASSAPTPMPPTTTR